MTATAHGPSIRRTTTSMTALPSPRALVGALLVTASGFGLFATHQAATAAPTTTYFVAARALQPGQRIGTSDVKPVTMRLPSALRAQAYDNAHDLIGAHVLGPVGTGELLQATGVNTNAVGDGIEVSFAIEPSRALDGHLRAGERVDVLATVGSGNDASTTVVANNALVIGGSQQRNSLSPTSQLTVDLKVADRDTALALTNAVDTGKLTLARSS